MSGDWLVAWQTPPEDIGVGAPLVTLGLDSMQGMELHAVLERKFGIGIPEAVMFDPDTNLKDLFPTDLNASPYRFSEFAKEVELNDLSFKPGSDIGRDLMEYLYPMKHPGFPYYSSFIPLAPSPNAVESVSYTLSKWYALTCAGAFAMWRKVYVALALLGRWMIASICSISSRKVCTSGPPSS